jgi:hypothetical protein
MPDYQISATLNAQVTGFKQGMAEATKASNTAAKAIESNLEKVGGSAKNAGEAVSDAGVAAEEAGVKWQDLAGALQENAFESVRGAITELLPAAGLAGIAFSALGLAIAYAQSESPELTKELKENSRAMDSAKLSGDEYAETLDKVTQSQLRGAQNAAKELVELKTLYAIATDVTVAYKQRKDAVDELQKQYPVYFKNITDEALLAGKAQAAYDALTVSIIATSRARAAQDLLVKNQERRLENEQKLIDLQKAGANAAIKINTVYDKMNSKFLSTGMDVGTGINRANAVFKATDALNGIIKQQNDLKTDNAILDRQSLELIKSINTEVKKGADLADYTPPAAKKERVKKQKKIKIDRGFQIADTKGQKDFLDPTFAFRQAEGFRSLLRTLTAYQSGIQGIEQTLTAAQTRMIENAVSFNEQFAAITNQGFKQAIGGIAEAMGSALAEGGNVFQAIGQSLLQSLGGVLVQLGEMAIGIGVGLTAIKTALESLNPVLAIGAGIALVALGSFFKGKASNIGGNIKGGSGSNVTAFANGGMVYGPTNALIGEYSGAKNNPEVVAPLNKLRGMLGGNNFAPVLIPIANSKQLYILMKDGKDKYERQ